MQKTKKRQTTKRMLPLIVVVILALTMALPVLADGPPDQSGKGCKGQQKECAQTAQQDHPERSGKPESPGKAQVRPEQTGKPENPGKAQTRPEQTGKPENPGKAQVRPEQTGKPENPGKAQAHPEQTGKPENPGKAQARPEQPGKPENPGKAQARPEQTGKPENPGKAQARPEQTGKPENPGMPLAGNQSVGPEVQTYPGTQVLREFGATFAPTLVSRERGKPARESVTVKNIPQASNTVRIINSGGLKNLRVTVNGQRFQVAGLKHGDERDIDVSSAMKAGNDNTIVFTALGKPGTSAMVEIGG